MALGERTTARQAELWVAVPQLPVSPGHVFYEKLNGLLAEAGFDPWIEGLCDPLSIAASRSTNFAASLSHLPSCGVRLRYRLGAVEC